MSALDQKPTLDMVVLAVSSLYNNPNPTEKERASLWLGEFQKSVHAWTIADELLHHKCDLESCYFAAQTLRTKIQQCFYELPLEAHVSLRDSLLEHINQTNENTHTVIVTQLCLALSDLALQMPTWQQPVFDLINRFSQSHTWPLLEILTVLPEELESRSVRLGENRRTEMLENLKHCAPMVDEFLKHCCSTFGDNLQENIHGNIKTIRCFTSWVSVSAISLESLTDNLVVSKAFVILSYQHDGQKLVQVPGALHEVATDSICTILQCLEDNNNYQDYEIDLIPSPAPGSTKADQNTLVSPHIFDGYHSINSQDPQEMPFSRSNVENLKSHESLNEGTSRWAQNAFKNSDLSTPTSSVLQKAAKVAGQALEMYLFNKVLSLEESYHLSVANEDQEKSLNYCRIFTELAESFLDKIITHSSEETQYYAVKVVDLVLMCVGHHDYEVAEVTFNFWYLLSEELYLKNTKNSADLFRPFVERLITALCRHCQMEPDHEGLLEDGDDFKDFRSKVSDLVKDVVFIVGSSNSFGQMFINLQSPGVTWDSSEATLFIMQAVAKNILPSENEIVPKVVEAILVLPENTHVAVKYTSVLLLGELCEWIEQHPTSLDPILNFLVYCLSQPDLGAAAATALQSICASCNDHMSRHLPVLLQLLHQIDKFAIAHNAIIGLLKGVASIIGCMSHTDIPAVLRELCMLQTHPLCQLMEKDVAPTRGTKTDPVIWLDRLASVFRNVAITISEGQTNPCRSVALEIWPVLNHAMDKYQNDFRIMERCCRSIRFMLRCVSQQIREILQPLVGQIVSLYNSHQHSCFLYLGSILVDEYAADEACVNGLLDMLQSFITPAFNLLQQENGLRNNPDTVDDFFRLCGRMLQRAPLPFLQCQSVDSILQCALLACSLDHKEANTSVMKFFYDLISTGYCGKVQPDYERRKKAVQSIVTTHGQQLVTNLIHACVFYLHTYMLPEVSDVISELLHFNRELASSWLRASLEALPKQGNGGIITATPHQLNDFYISVTVSDTSKSVTHALKDLIRLYR